MKIAAALMLILFSKAVFACNVPVFKYALDGGSRTIIFCWCCGIFL